MSSCGQRSRHHRPSRQRWPQVRAPGHHEGHGVVDVVGPVAPPGRDPGLVARRPGAGVWDPETGRARDALPLSPRLARQPRERGRPAAAAPARAGERRLLSLREVLGALGQREPGSPNQLGAVGRRPIAPPGAPAAAPGGGPAPRLAPRVPPRSAGRRRRPRCLSSAPPQAGRGRRPSAPSRAPSPQRRPRPRRPGRTCSPPSASRAPPRPPRRARGAPRAGARTRGGIGGAERSVARQRRVASRPQPSQRLPHTGHLGARLRGLVETIAGPPSIPAPPVTERTGPGLPRARCLAWRLLLGGRPSLGGENRPAQAVVPLGWRLHRGVSLRKPPKSLLK